MRQGQLLRRSARWRRRGAYVDTPAADTVSRSMHMDTVPMMPMASPTAAHTQTVKTTPLLPMYHGAAARTGRTKPTARAAISRARTRATAAGG